MVNFYHRFLPICPQVLRPLNDLLKGWGPIRCSGLPRHGRLSRMKSASSLQQYSSNITPHKLNFLLPLTPPILISAVSCSRNLGTIGNHLISFQENWPTWSLVTSHSIVKCWLHMQQLGIFTIFLKVALFNCGQITNHL
jgi:hypothetical protein